MQKSSTHSAQSIRSIGLILFSALIICACKDTRQPVVRENIKLTDSLDLFEKPLIPKAAATPSENVVATVNGHSILQGHLEREANAIAVKLRNSLPPERIAQQKDKILNQALNNLIIQLLLRGQIESEQVSVDEAEVASGLENIRKSLPPDVAFSDFLKRSNLTEEALIQNIRTELRVQALVKKNVGQIEPPSDAEVEAFYAENEKNFMLPERVEAEHILVSVPKNSDFSLTQERSTLASSLQKLVAGGKTVAEVLLDYPDSEIIRGGPVTFARGQIDKGLESVLFAMKATETSEVSTSPLGLHIFYAKAVLPSGTMPLEDAIAPITNALTQQRTQKRMSDYIKLLREKADIDIKI